MKKEINIIDLEKSGGLLYHYCNKPLNTKEYNPSELQIKVYPSKNETVFNFYDDDGESTKYKDGIYNLMNENKSTILQPKVSITKKDLEEIADLRQLRDAIEVWEKKLKTAKGKDAYVIKKTIIDLRKDQYIIKNSYRCPVMVN